MDRLLKLIDEMFIEFSLIAFVIFVSFFIYLTSTTEPIKSRVRGAFQGGFIAVVFAYPVWTYIGKGNLAALILITAILCISGQFLIEPIQKAVPKYVKKVIDKLTGGNSNDTN